MTQKVDKLKRVCLKDPVKLSIENNTDMNKQKYKQSETLIQRYIFIPNNEKDISLV